jgi:hypothetical protein
LGLDQLVPRLGLGAVRIELGLGRDSLTARIYASRAPAATLLTRHLPVSKEGVPAPGADVQTEALDDHAMKVRASAHTNLVAPIDLRKSTWRIAVLLRESRAPE